MNNRYEGVFIELLKCLTAKQMLETLHAHIEQVDQGMLEAVINDDRFADFYTELIKAVLKAKAYR